MPPKLWIHGKNNLFQLALSHFFRTWPVAYPDCALTEARF